MSALMLVSETASWNPLQEDSQLGNRVRKSAVPTSRKRKLEEDHEPNEALGDVITVRLLGTNDNESRLVRPKQIIDRSALPLSYLRLNGSSSVDVPLFSASISSLESYGHGTDKKAKVLIVQEEDASLAAVEKVSQDIYAICPLADWVKLLDFGRKAAKQSRVGFNCVASAVAKKDQPGALSVQLKTEAKTSSRLLDFILADRPQAVKPSKSVTPKKIEPTLVQTLAAPQDSVQHNVEEENSTDWLQTIRQYYLDTLYTSRAPVAYFIKGPLSRARVACQANDTTPDLIELLRANILPVKFKGNAAVIDKKYNQAILAVLNEIPAGMALEDSHEITGPLKDRISKSKRRKKINSEGLLIAEECCIVAWWIKREETFACEGSADTREKRIKQATREQKMRETQLQIILILEVLALEKQVGAIDIKDTTANQQETAMAKLDAVASKKPQDLVRTLDVLVEKLQIWETMTDEVVATSSTANVGSTGAANNCLRSFCLDVVLPFFSSRIPEVSKILCQKFGVPVSPEKKLTRSISSHQSSTKPGEPLKERRARKSLTRVSTNESVGPGRRAPSLIRSATDSLIPSLKHELEDATLSMIPKHRVSISQSKLYARREVDLTAEVKATEAKLKRKAQIEQELKGAIFALKKPNARLAVQEFVDASDQRNAPQKSRSRKCQNPVRNPFATGVQVTATPRAKRHQPRQATISKLQSSPEEADLAVVPPSSAPRIPSSSIKPRTCQYGIPGAGALTATPSRSARLAQEDFPKAPNHAYLGFAMIQHPVMKERAESDSEPELPLMRPPKIKDSKQSSAAKIVDTPCKAAVSKLHLETSEATPSFVFSTPRKSTSDGEAVVLHSSPPRKLEGISADQREKHGDSITKDISIYDELGWDNDFNDI